MKKYDVLELNQQFKQVQEPTVEKLLNLFKPYLRYEDFDQMKDIYREDDCQAEMNCVPENERWVHLFVLMTGYAELMINEY